MDRKIILVKEILNSSFTSDNFTKLVTMLFDDVKLKDKVVFRKEYSNYSSHIDESAHIGDYVDPNGKRIVLFAVKLKKENYVENSRGTQRNYAKSILDNNNYDAAIIAFFMDDDSKWRLSFVRLDYEIKFEGGKSKTNEVLTPARRYSFLVGKDEPSHTAIKQLSTFIEDDNYRPTLNELEEAFSVEKVTKEFYKLYCEKYHLLRDHLDNNEEFLEEAGRHNFDSVQFAKKLMGQIVFLYFLQKKGWLGVNVWPQLLSEKEYWNVYYASSPLKREIQEALPNVYVAYGENQYRLNYAALKRLPSDVDEAIAKVLPRKKSWGDGPRDFMRKLFQDAQRNKANFFDEYLEPLFYDAMNQNRGDNGYFTTLHCRVPFLSGGLFEPIDGYDWKHTNFNIPNELFSSVDENKDSSVYEADGILDIFDRFNFTMSEDEPLEREVAVDPEMLGKVFENLLEIKDRKSKGAFYTPREIVHYMCQQSLVNYLVTKTGIEESAIRDFVLYGDVYKDYDVQLIKEKQYDKLYISELLFKLDARGNKVIDKLLEIDKALENVKIADPAVGSGAFPLGLLNEIVRMRESITTYFAIGMDNFSRIKMYNYERCPYSLKRDTIKNCIYAADIEPSAVDIARLRLWLALVIDDNVIPGSSNTWDHVNPISLPNLESNIVCGNSLIDEFRGFKLIDSTLNNTFTGQQPLGQAEYSYYLKEIVKEQDKLFECNVDNDKRTHKNKIALLRKNLIEAQLRNEGATQKFFDDFVAAEHMASKPYVLWQIDFAKVFLENGGFDIVIGNPPYVSAATQMMDDKLLDNRKNIICCKRYTTLHSKWDLYIPFMELGLKLLRNSGIFSMIVPYPLTNQIYAKKLRELILDKYNMIEIVDLKDTKVFEATVQNCIPFIVNEKYKGFSEVSGFEEGKIQTRFIQDRNNLVQDKKSIVWNLTKEYRSTTKFSGMNILGDFCYISKGMVLNADEKKAKGEFKKKDLISTVCDEIHPKKFIEGKDIDKYCIKRVRYLEWGTDRSPKALSRPTFEELYTSPKLLFNCLGELKVAIDRDGGYYCEQAIRVAVPWHYLNGVNNNSISGVLKKYSNLTREKHEELSRNISMPYLLGIMNSKTGAQLLADLRGGDYHIVPEHIRNIPIPLVDEGRQKEVESVVERLISLMGELDNTEEFKDAQNELNEVVKRIYGDYIH